MTPQEEGKLVATVERLVVVVDRLTICVEKLQSKQSYWAGALAAVGIMSGAIGALAALMVQWFHK